MQNNINNTPQQATGYTPYIPPKKEYAPLDKKDFSFIIIYLVAVFLMVMLGLFGGFQLGFTIAYFVLFAVTTVYLWSKGNRPSAFTVLSGALSLVGSVTLSLYSDYFVNFIMLVLIAGLFTIYSMGMTKSFTHSVGSFRMLFDMGWDAVIAPFSNFSNVFGGIKASAGKGKKSFSSFIGIAIAVPFVLIIGALLVSSDAAFEGLVSKTFANIGIYIGQLVIAIIILPYAYSWAFSKRHGSNKIDSSNATKQDKKGVPSSACVSFLSVISILYIVYLFSQLAYFFSAFKGILPDDYEYSASAFARRGFFEMFAICAINVVLISIASAIANKKTIWLKVLSCFISLFSLLLIVTAMQKMKLNVSIYGLSKNRVLVSVFMVMMIVIIALFIMHIFAPKISYMQPAILICSALFIAMSFADIDAQIARYNINAYEAKQIDTLDVENIADLSDSAVPYLVKLIDSKDEQISKDALRICAQLVADNYNDFYSGKNSDFRHFSLSLMRATIALDDANLSKEIASIAKLYKDDDCYYNEDEDCFEYYYDDAEWNRNGIVHYCYNKDTRQYDIIKHYNENGREVTEKTAKVVYSSKD